MLYDDIFGSTDDPSKKSPTLAAAGVSQPTDPYGQNAMTSTPTSASSFRVDTPDSTPKQPEAQTNPGGAWASLAGVGSGTESDLPASTPSPQATTPQATTNVGGTADVSARFKDLTAQIQAATDPGQQAILRDKLARDVFGSLQDAGHDVQWDGDQLVVDGRRYVVGGGSGGAYEQGGVAGPRAEGGTPQPQSTAAPGAYHTNLMEGDVNKLRDTAHAAESPKYDFLQLAQQNKYDYTQMPQMLEELKAGPNGRLWQGWQADGKGNFVFAGNPSQLAPEWKGVTRVDAVGAFGNIAQGGQASGWRWGVDDGGGAAPAAGGADDMQSLYNQIFFDPPQVRGGGGGDSGGEQPATSLPAWAMTGPTYSAGAIDDSDLSGLTMDDILGRIGPTTNPSALPTDYQAGQISNDPLSTYDFGGYGDLGELGAGRTDAQTEDLVSQILAHPESMDPRTVEMLKAKSKDELADMARSDDEDLVAQGYLTGNPESNWLASERLASKGRRDQSLVQSNRAIDMQAAETNAADRARAAGIGQSYAESKAGRNLAARGERFNEAQSAEGRKQAAVDSRNNAASFKRQGELANEQLRGEASDRNLKAAQQNIDNQFKSAQEKQQAVKMAADTQLAAAAQKGDRRALEQQFQQKAAELGQSADKIRQDYTLALLDDATKRYGIDTGAAVDRAKLSEQSVEFQQDLIFRLMALKQADRQFGAQYGLDLSRLEQQANDSAWNQAFGSAA